VRHDPEQHSGIRPDFLAGIRPPQFLQRRSVNTTKDKLHTLTLVSERVDVLVRMTRPRGTALEAARSSTCWQLFTSFAGYFPVGEAGQRPLAVNRMSLYGEAFNRELMELTFKNATESIEN
jgi:hypothetical protein